jgi:hypothetical protein
MRSKMSLKARKELIFSVRLNYQKSNWKEKSKILNAFIGATGYQRKYAISLLNITDINQPDKIPHKKTRKYNQAVQEILLIAWHAANGICGKRLVPFLPELITVLERHGHLTLSSDMRRRLFSISAATVDRLLKTERSKQGKGISTTKPGSLLKKQIKVRTFADWDNVIPGFLEGDLVAHCGDGVDGSFLNTLVLTDIASGWTEFLPLLCKSSANVITGMNIVLEILPFPLLGIDTDNGSEFINYELLNFCRENKITFTRSRAYKKNDQAHVEEKNGSIVRRVIGYDRYEGTASWHALADLYAILRLYVNYFQPSLKLLSKKRDGSKVTKKYDKAQTPCQRLLNSENVAEAVKIKLRKEYENLDPINLLERLNKCQDTFWRYAWITQNKNVRELKTAAINTTPKSDQNTNINNKLVTDFKEEVNRDLPNRKYRYTKKPRKTMHPRTWRTRKDPFETVWDNLQLQLKSTPRVATKSLLDGLISEQPEKFNCKLLRTLQRRIAVWRKEQEDTVKKQHLAISEQDSSTNKYLSLVMEVKTG